MTPVRFDEEAPLEPQAATAGGAGHAGGPPPTTIAGAGTADEQSGASTGGDGGVVGRIRKARAEQRKRKRLTLEVPKSGGLGVRYAPMEFERVPQAARVGLFGSPDEQLREDVTSLAEACEAIVIRNDAGDWGSLADTLRADGQTITGEIRFDDQLVAFLDEDPVDGPEQAVMAMFGHLPSPESAVTEHARIFFRWTMTGDRLGDDEPDEEPDDKGDGLGEGAATAQPA